MTEGHRELVFANLAPESCCCTGLCKGPKLLIWLPCTSRYVLLLPSRALAELQGRDAGQLFLVNTFSGTQGVQQLACASCDLKHVCRAFLVALPAVLIDKGPRIPAQADLISQRRVLLALP